MTQKSRRAFIRQCGTAAAVTAGWPAILRAAKVRNPIRYGVIGCGSRGRLFLEGAAYVCDPDRERLAKAAARAGVDAAHAVTDFRTILDDRSIDAVVIATPDHWHAPAGILACEAGKHVYVEKPCSHNIRESRLLLNAARRNRVVVQHGTQQRSAPFTIDAIDRLRDGIIGDVLIAKAWNIQRRETIGHAEPTDPPAHVDYDLWVGPAEMVPFQENRFHYQWHWWYNFGTGDIGNDGAHELDYARWGLGVDTLPTKATAIGGKYYFDDDQEFPDTATCVFEYPADARVKRPRQLIFELRLWSTNYPMNCDSGVEFLGTRGKMFLSKRGKLEIFGDRNTQIESIRERPNGLPLHVANFFDAIRTDSRPHADIEDAHRSVALIHLANIAVRTGQSLVVDPDKETIVDQEPASRLLSRTYRHEGHWAIPNEVNKS